MSRKERLKGITIKMEDESTEVSTKLEQKQENCRDDMSRLDLYMNFEEVANAIQRSLYSFRSDSIDRKDIKRAIKVIRTALKIMIGNEAIAIHNIPGMNAGDFNKESQAHVEDPEIDDDFCIDNHRDDFMKLLKKGAHVIMPIKDRRNTDGQPVRITSLPIHSKLLTIDRKKRSYIAHGWIPLPMIRIRNNNK